MQYESITISSRDVKILQLMEEALESYGYTTCCLITEVKKDRQNVLRITNLHEAISDALDTIPLAILHPKLKILRSFLDSLKNRLPLSHGSSRLRFYDFIENNVNDKLLVLAQ